MLRNYVGDSAFFKSLNLYLTRNKFKSAEVQNLRLAFEEITGQDLNWFFNEWYYGNGHPKLDISYDFDAAGKTAKVYISQTQSGNPFKLPFVIDLYEAGNKKRYHVWMNNTSDTFSFAVNSKPDLINVDGDKVLLCEKNDHKTLKEFIYQYNHAGLYVDRREAVEFAAKNETDPAALAFIEKALGDKSWQIRSGILGALDVNNDTVKRSVEGYLVNVAKNDPRRVVKAQAIQLLGKYKNIAYKPLFMKAVNDSSYTVAGNALEALSAIDDAAAEIEAKKLMTQPYKGVLRDALFGYTDENKFDSLAAVFESMPLGGVKANMVPAFANFLGRVSDANNFEKGVDMIVNFREQIPQQFRANSNPFFNGELKKLLEKKQAKGLTEQADYVKSKLPKDNAEQ